MHTNEHSGIFISHKALMSLPPLVRAAVVKAALGDEVVLSLQGNEGDELPGASNAVSSVTEDEGFVELTPRMARKYAEGCGEKTKLALETMAKGKSRFFQVSDIASALNVSAPELRGVWGGLTRRVKTVTGDDSAYLISWAGSEPVYDTAGVFTDQRGELTEMTYQSLRKVFSL